VVIYTTGKSMVVQWTHSFGQFAVQGVSSDVKNRDIAFVSDRVERGGRPIPVFLPSTWATHKKVNAATSQQSRPRHSTELKAIALMTVP